MRGILSRSDHGNSYGSRRVSALTTVAREESSNRCENGSRIPHDVFADHAQRRVALFGERPIATAVLPLRLPRGVMCPAVALDHEPALHEEVDTTDTRHVHLDVEAASERSQKQPQKRLRSRLGSGIDELPQHPVSTRQRGEQGIEVVTVQHAEPKGRVDRRHRCARRLAAHGLYESVERVDRERSRMRSPMQLAPMERDQTSDPPVTRSIRRDVHVERTFLQYEHPKPSELGETRQPAADASRGQATVCCVGAREGATPQSSQRTRFDGRPDATVRPTRGEEVGTAMQERSR